METKEQQDAIRKQGFSGLAFYMIPKDGGFQLRRLHVEDDKILMDEAVGDADAWNQIMSELEFEFSKKFQ